MRVPDLSFEGPRAPDPGGAEFWTFFFRSSVSGNFGTSCFFPFSRSCKVCHTRVEVSWTPKPSKTGGAKKDGKITVKTAFSCVKTNRSVFDRFAFRVFRARACVKSHRKIYLLRDPHLLILGGGIPGCGFWPILRSPDPRSRQLLNLDRIQPRHSLSKHVWSSEAMIQTSIASYRNIYNTSIVL